MTDFHQATSLTHRLSSMSSELQAAALGPGPLEQIEDSTRNASLLLGEALNYLKHVPESQKKAPEILLFRAALDDTQHELEAALKTVD